MAKIEYVADKIEKMRENSVKRVSLKDNTLEIELNDGTLFSSYYHELTGEYTKNGSFYDQYTFDLANNKAQTLHLEHKDFAGFDGYFGNFFASRKDEVYKLISSAYGVHRNAGESIGEIIRIIMFVIAGIIFFCLYW